MMRKEKQIDEMVEIVSKCMTKWLNNETPKSFPNYIAEETYNAGYRKQEWISVEDDSPKENGIYCVMVEHRKSRKYKQKTHAKYKNGRWLDLYDNWENRCWKVTHWMPLPEAPKGGDKDNE